jgi:hypothetical protein
VGVTSTCRMTSSPGAERVKLNPKVSIFITVIKYSVIRQVHNLFQSDCSTQCDLLLAPATSSIFSFPSDHSVVACLFLLVFLSLNYIRNGIVDFVPLRGIIYRHRKGLLL